MPSAKRKAVTIERRIFEAAAGLRARAFKAEAPTYAITSDGPIVLKNIIKVIVKLSIFLSFYHYNQFVLKGFGNPSIDLYGCVAIRELPFL